MERIGARSLAAIRFELTWNSAEAAHVERFLGRKVNTWRDIFPPQLKERLTGLGPGDAVRVDYAPGQAVAPPAPGDLARIPNSQFQRRDFRGQPLEPRLGRFYPRGMLGNLVGVHPQDLRPCRIVHLDPEILGADLSHPLAERELTLRAEVEQCAYTACETGGRLTHWMEELAGNGPGMQARRAGAPTDFAGPGAFGRADPAPDPEFYAQPRLVDHADAQAREFLAREHALRVPAGGVVLDLMSSARTHLPEGHAAKVVGLGLNARELKANPLLAGYNVQDLNQDPRLPCLNETYDAVLCALSLEYLTDPGAVVAEAARALKPGAPLILSFSNRWFPAKATRLWQELHEFERLGFALDLLLRSGRFTALETLSIRNWWRPEDDPHIRRTWTSDPVYLVSGRRR